MIPEIEGGGGIPREKGKSGRTKLLAAGGRWIYFAAEIPPAPRGHGGAGKQQVPPLRRRWRSGSGRNDKVVEMKGPVLATANKKPSRCEREGG